MATENRLPDQQSDQINESTNAGNPNENTNTTDTEDNYKSWNTRDALDESNLKAIATNDVATNDGSTIESLDTALHNKPGYAEGETISGSNRADFYEARSGGKSDVEEELEVLKKKHEG
jgi:hypothetical protein